MAAEEGVTSGEPLVVVAAWVASTGATSVGVGEIVEVGSNVNDFHPGQIVSGEGHVVCGRCRNCMAGRRHLCAHTSGIGVDRPGAFAEYLSLPMSNVWEHRTGIDLDVAALFDPSLQRLTEETPLADAKSAYGKSKAECDEYVRGLVTRGASVAMTYPSGVIGPDDPAMSEGNQGIAYFFNMSFMHTTAGMQLIDVRELANVHVKLLEQQKTGPYLVTGHYQPYRQLGQTMDGVISRPLLKLPAP